MADQPDPSVCSVPLETEDGDEVVICQENVGPGNQVGGGEWKNGTIAKTPDEAAREQEALEGDTPANG